MTSRGPPSLLPDREIRDFQETARVQVAITCRHGSIRDEVREYISTKAEKLLTYFERVTAIEVTVDFDNDHIRIEILVDAEHRHNFVARDEGPDVPGTFDRALHKMEQQIRKYKEKLQDHRRDRPLNEVLAAEAAENEPPRPETD
jgi:putative sigma-54 modulation protein